MPYIVGLLIILALIFSGWNGIGLTGNFLNQMKDKVSSTIFPKTEGEILIENLNSNYQVLDKFFGESANKKRPRAVLRHNDTRITIVDHTHHCPCIEPYTLTGITCIAR